MKILFVVPRNKSLFGGKGMTTHPHIGVAYLSAFLKHNGVKVAVFDEGLDEDLQNLYDLVRDFNPALVGITIFSYCYGFAYNLIQKLKENTSLPIVAGGPHVSAVRTKIIAEAGVDFAVKQEGEFTLIELLQTLERKDLDFSHIKGLIWKNPAGLCVENADRELINDLDHLPFPDYDVFGIERYMCHKQKMLPIITSRGCPFGCNYCSVRLSMGRKFRARSAENVFSEIKYLHEKGYRSFDINDDCFTLNQERAEIICDLIRENNLNIRFQLYNGIRVDAVNPSLLVKMRQAGCYFISYGCEAGNNKVLQAINKGITLEQVRQAVEWANEAGIPNSVNFIVGHKEETYNDALDSLNFADSLPTNFVNFYNLIPYPGTESFEWASQHADFLVPPDSFLDRISYRDNEPIFETKEFTESQRRKIVVMGFELYRKKILVFRLGKVLGSLVYLITKINVINKIASQFALSTKIGKFIFVSLSKRSFKAKGN